MADFTRKKETATHRGRVGKDYGDPIDTSGSPATTKKGRVLITLHLPAKGNTTTQYVIYIINPLSKVDIMRIIMLLNKQKSDTIVMSIRATKQCKLIFVNDSVALIHRVVCV